MPAEVIDCKMLFDAIRERESDFWLAGLILTLKIDSQKKYNVGRKLIKTEDAFNWFLSELYNGGYA